MRTVNCDRTGDSEQARSYVLLLLVVAAAADINSGDGWISSGKTTYLVTNRNIPAI